MTSVTSPTGMAGISAFAPRPVAALTADLGAQAPQRSAASVGFDEMLGRAVDSGVRHIRDAERVSSAGLMGQASTVELATAMARAEVALQATIAVRDRVVAAYQEVMRMPV
jgi:flagellar hook-basal body complex protein FliE